MPFESGAVGDDSTQVLSGCMKAEEILMLASQAQGTLGGDGGLRRRWPLAPPRLEVPG